MKASIDGVTPGRACSRWLLSCYRPRTGARNWLLGWTDVLRPAALATAAHLLARATRKDPQQRLAGKLALTRRLYQRGWTKPEVLDLYEFIDWLLALPEALEDAFLDEIHDLEASTKMQYISSAERIGMKRGTQLGIQQVLRRQLRRRFGDPPAWVESKLQEGTPPQLEQWADQLLDADTLEAVFKE